MNKMISEITPFVIDDWINWLKDLDLTNRRASFKHEYDLLSGILKFYSGYDDDFKSPLKRRHRQNIILRDSGTVKGKFISEEEFLKFRENLLSLPDGKTFAAMATVQFYQSLRISEVSAICWEDLKIVPDNLSRTTIHISRSVFFSRKKGAKPEIQNSFKNSKGNNGIKVLPLLKESYDVLFSLKEANAKHGLVFLDQNKELFSYRQIQHAYDSAFKMAELPFRATHIMRHGGASYVYNKTNGDLSMVQAMTGNRDYKSALVYAHRNPLAIQAFAEKDWNERSEVQEDLLHKSP